MPHRGGPRGRGGGCRTSLPSRPASRRERGRMRKVFLGSSAPGGGSRGTATGAPTRSVQAPVRLETLKPIAKGIHLSVTEIIYIGCAIRRRSLERGHAE